MLRSKAADALSAIAKYELDIENTSIELQNMNEAVEADNNRLKNLQNDNRMALKVHDSFNEWSRALRATIEEIQKAIEHV